MRTASFTCLWLVIISLMQAFTSYCSDTANVTVTVEPVLVVCYTGGDVVFQISYCDIGRGYKTQGTDDDVRWSTNVGDWDIFVERGDWEQTEGGADWNPPDDYIPLQINYEAAGDDDWHNVTTEPTIWVSGADPGTGRFEDLEWKVVEIGWDDDPGSPPTGTYSCTVTFTIENS